MKPSPRSPGWSPTAAPNANQDHQSDRSSQRALTPIVHQVVRLDRASQWTMDTVDAMRRQLSIMGERRNALITAAVAGQFDVSTASGRGVTE